MSFYSDSVYPINFWECLSNFARKEGKELLYCDKFSYLVNQYSSDNAYNLKMGYNNRLWVSKYCNHEQQKFITEYYKNGRSHKDIANILSRSVSYVVALEKSVLRKCMTDFYISNVILGEKESNDRLQDRIELLKSGIYLGNDFEISYLVHNDDLYKVLYKANLLSVTGILLSLKSNRSDLYSEQLKLLSKRDREVLEKILADYNLLN